MDKIEKYLRRLTKQERSEIESVLVSLLKGDTKQLHMKKLKGYADVYRIKVGRSRIIFQQTGDNVRLIDIARRNEKTYKNI